LTEIEKLKNSFIGNGTACVGAVVNDF
jgi:hypothetical protein